LIAWSWWALLSANTGLLIRTSTVEGTPIQFMVSQQVSRAPGILITHGFSGSRQLMLGYAYTLAHNGYGVLLWDHRGHGANGQPFQWNSLQDGFKVALATLKQQPEVDPLQLAILGHSMGSRVAMQAGIEQPNDLQAVVAISPVNAAVTSELPKNLSLQAGEWEPQFVETATQLLNQAGGTNTDLANGKGRSLAVIPGVEHATILFHDASHQAALQWLNQTFARQTNHPYRDRRMGWYGLQLLGWLIILGTVLPQLKPRITNTLPKPRLLREWGGLLLSPLVAALVLKLTSFGGAVEHLGGLLLGGALGFWFFIAGLVWWAVMARWLLPKLNDLRVGFASFALLWVGLGAAAQVVWLPWFMIPARLPLWFFITIACLPWFLASGLVQQQQKLLPRLGWWLGQSVAFIVGLIGTIIMVPSLGFLVILLPLFPVLFGLFSFLAAKIQSPWAVAIGCAGIFSWLIVTPFPLV
jgi:pimeloyl-ACP methyl ester carboxylesterase